MNSNNPTEIKKVYQPLFDVAHSIILRWDAKGTIIYVNKYGARFFGYEASELIGNNVMILVPQVDSKGVNISALAKDILNNPTKYINHVNENIKKDGEIVHIAWTNKAIIDKNSNVIEVVAIGNDITNHIKIENELHDANQELILKNKQLEANNDLIKNLLYIAAHDLKGPIGNFTLIFELIDIAVDDQEKLDLLSKIKNTYLQLDKVINGLNKILKIEDIEKHATIINLENLLNDLLLNEFYKYRKFISCDFSAINEILYVELFLISIFKNLISNAIKYQKPEAPLFVTIKSEKINDYVQITFEDNGIGIDLTTNADKLFMPFTRFTSQAEGSGIGLHLIKNMIIKNGGDIQVESSHGVGTKFICLLKEYATINA